MKKNQVSRFLYLSLRLSQVVFIIGLCFCFWQTRNMGNKFDETKLNISILELKTIWGKPDMEFDMNQNMHRRHIIIYDDFFGYKYIFTVQHDQEIISGKFIDD